MVLVNDCRDIVLVPWTTIGAWIPILLLEGLMDTMIQRYQMGKQREGSGEQTLTKTLLSAELGLAGAGRAR